MGAPRDDRYLRFLCRIWEAARQLPPRPCAVLLLSLQDSLGDSCLAPLPLCGIASVREIAAAMGLREADLIWLWDKLPADDGTIAHTLCVPRQQVLLVRESTRRWLLSRLRTAASSHPDALTAAAGGS
jgi:hypothetical protein